MRLIDADSLLEELRKMEVISPDRKDLFTGPARIAVFGRIGEQPTIDAVPVVRCGECKNYDGEFRCKWFTFDQEGMPVFMQADDFCSYGERKEAIHD
jgi:hypothetical protein